MANPRKFSEKIALHNKKQAEETAAFEAVLREVSATTQGAVGRQFCGQSQQPQHLTHPTEAVCRGGSLPNVKFASNNSIDLKNALHCLEGMKHESGRQSLIDKLQHRDRSRQLHEVNQSRHVEKRRDCSPYNLAYLSPPPDTSWRRANSDSAIHASTLTAPDQQSVSLPINSSPPSPVNGTVRTVDMPVGSPTFRMMSSEPFTNMRQSCSCDVPGISIHPSPEQDSGIHIPPISSNTGSLPDLSELQFGVPGTPDDGTTDHSSSYHHIGPMRSSGSQGSPSSRHRRSRAGPKPLVLHPSGHGQFQPGVMQPTMMRYSGGSVSDCGTPSPSPISPSLSQHSYSPPSPGFFSDAFYMLQQQQQNQLQQQFERASLLHDSPLDTSQTSFYHMLQPQSPAMFHFSQANCGGMDYTSAPAMSQPMPGSCRASGVTGITPGFYNSMPSPLSAGACQYGSPVPQYQTGMKSATPSEQIRFNIGNDNGNVNMTQSGNRIPDIILTGADDMFGQFNHRDFDTSRCFNDLLCFDDALGILDPLALDELQMLTDANVLTDQATEDSFRFD